MLSCQSLVPAHQGMKMRLGRWKCLGVVGATPPLWIPAFARMTNSVAGTIHFRANDDVRFADYRNGLGVLTVSINCLSAWENALEVPNIKELKTPGRCTAVRTCVSTLARITGHFRIV